MLPQPDPTFLKTELRRAFGHFATGVAVVTTLGDGGRPLGMTANSICSVSLDPPLMMFCVGGGNRSAASYCACGWFGINILGLDQRELANRFAGRSVTDRWAGVNIRAGIDGLPMLEDALAQFECQTVQSVPAGDHHVVIGHVRAFNLGSRRPPLGFFGGQFGTFQGHPAEEAQGGPPC